MSKNVVELPESLRSIVNVVEEIRRSLNEVRDHTRELDDTLSNIKYELERQASVQERTTRELQQLKDTVAQLKALMGSPTVTDKPQDTAEVHITENKGPVPTPESKVPPADKGEESGSYTASSFWSSWNSFTDYASSKPAMNGNGFSHVTWEYLRKLSKKE
jgi:Sec-independent protein translocase protein TatA